jgi:hypothetical protein
VFFLTQASLVPQDVDTSFDVYDAHVCSGAVPCVSAVVSPPACASGDSCKAAPSLQPAIFGAPSSATFSGEGNIAPPAQEGLKPKPRAKPVRCRRGYVKKGARCVRVRRAGKRAAAKRTGAKRRGK